MSLTTIIREIDAYLERLEQARDLLSQSLIPMHRSRTHRHWGGIERHSHIEGGNNARRGEPSKVQSRRPARKPKSAAAPPNLESQRQLDESCDASRVQNSPAAASRQAQQTKHSPAVSGRGENWQAATRRRKPPQVGHGFAMSEQEKPAKALSSPPVSGWIAVSPEKAKRARENAAPAGPISFVAPTTAVAGRQAFETLFGNGSAASGNPSE